jgi:hypothetical protein
MQDSSYRQAPPARTITTVTLPEEAREFIQEGKLMDGLNPDLFGDHGTAMAEVAGFASQLGPSQQELLLVGLRHAFKAEHGATVHFAEQEAGYELLGTGVEIKDDSEEGSTGPVGVFFATWNP